MIQNSGLCGDRTFRYTLDRYPEFRWDEQLDASLLGRFDNSPLHFQSHSCDGRDDDVNASESTLDGFLVRIVDWYHLDVAFNGRLRSLPWPMGGKHAAPVYGPGHGHTSSPGE